ncbi:manganese catalase family protein [Lederbergia ruris]|uniref:Uncharacterized protein n=1 Tax=Lederbergia ruris TaxID=217495 RepID=A0ABQ4KEM0_9BACI|nr:manganese catalase family protein [Lederbergia ruris]GIN56418.1 hypothetical protein J8TS2_07370 [Lederbergia ruris]
MSQQAKEQQGKKSNKPTPSTPDKFGKMIGGQTGEMTFMMQYHFHGFIP